MMVCFLMSLASGMLLVLSTAAVERIAWRFLRLSCLIALALLCLAIAWQARPSADRSVSTWMWVLGIASGLGSAFLVLAAPLAEHRSAMFRLICGLAGFAALSAAIAPVVRTALDETSGGPVIAALLSVSQILGAVLLGSITIAWLLGHAYLTATKMTIAPLQHFSHLLLLAVVARIVFFPIGLLGATWASGNALTMTGSQLAASWLILILRVGVGLAAVAVFAYMVADCVRLRATQSATGILYFASVFAYIGELAGWQLTAQYGWPA